MDIQIPLLLSKAFQICQFRVQETAVLTNVDYSIRSPKKTLEIWGILQLVEFGRWGGEESGFGEGKRHQTWFAVKLINRSVAFAISKKWW